jgi:hypothetical protein
MYDSLATTLYETQPVGVSDHWYGEKTLTKEFYYKKQEEDRGKIKPTIALSKDELHEIWIHVEIPSRRAARIIERGGRWESYRRAVVYQLQIEYEEQIDDARQMIIDLHARIVVRHAFQCGEKDIKAEVRARGRHAHTRTSLQQQ